MTDRAAPVDRVDPAVRRAREVVGLYGDPAATWSVVLELTFTDPLDIGQVGPRLAALVAEHPALGRVPEPRLVDDGGAGHGDPGGGPWRRCRESAAGTPYGDHQPLLRVAVSTGGRRLLVAGHHGVVDGLGLVAVAAAASGRRLTSQARGIGGRTASRSFLRSSVRRLGESLVAPAARLSPSGGSPGERLLALGVPPNGGTGALVAALLRVLGEEGLRGRPVVLVGASRRPPGRLAPDRRTAYFRYRPGPGWPALDAPAVHEQLAGLDPEPTFPETSWHGVGPLVTRALRRRLGATALVSNLGVLHGEGLESVALFPVGGGPAAVAVGLATVGEHATVSLRTGRALLDEERAALVLRRLAQHYRGEEGSRPQ